MIIDKLSLVYLLGLHLEMRLGPMILITSVRPRKWNHSRISTIHQETPQKRIVHKKNNYYTWKVSIQMWKFCNMTKIAGLKITPDNNRKTKTQVTTNMTLTTEVTGTNTENQMQRKHLYDLSLNPWIIA